MTSYVKTALTIAGSDSIGGAGVQADLKAFLSLGVHGCSAITCITAQNTSGIRRTVPISADMLRDQLMAILEDLTPGAAKTGAIYSSENVEAIADIFSEREIPLVIDPVLTATTGANLAEDSLISPLKQRLIPICAIVTPNLSEAERLTGVAISDLDHAAKAAELLLSTGASAVLIKGLVEGDKITDYLISSEGTQRVLSSSRVEGAFHGTGCILSALIAAHISLGRDICTAVVKARGALFLGIQDARSIGKGLKIINPIQPVLVAAERFEVLDKLSETGRVLEREMDVRLLPEVGSNLGYSISQPSNESDVAGFTGRIVRDGKHARVVGCPKFGASKHVARAILAARNHDPDIRSAMNIKFNERNTEGCRNAGLIVASFSRKDEPDGVSTMSWGVDSAIKNHGSVPDAIWDEGGLGKEPMIRIIGRDPEDILTKIRKISSELRE